MVAHPDVGEPEVLSLLGRGPDRLGRCGRPGLRKVNPELHDASPSLPTKAPEIPDPFGGPPRRVSAEDRPACAP